ncbi:MAG: flavin reductase [Pseudochelatococcus sp.]|jgi:flavin reductase|uniref:flavin reductase n=1 Tax=Pseudochelatococcus sp. TaxID=2020869 RepID=UPI003D8AC5B3
MQLIASRGGEARPAAPVSRTDYRDAMARLAAAVTIVTTDGPAGMAGFAATAVCSVTDSPPTLLVCLNRESSAHPAVSGNGVLCVNVLEGRHEALSGLFGGKTPMPRRFEAAAWRRAATGAPMLDDALVSFDCRIVSTCGVGSHDILLCEAVAIAGGDGEGEGDGARPLLYFGRAYCGIAAAPGSPEH